MSEDPAEAHMNKLWDEMCEARKQAERTGSPKDWMAVGMALERFNRVFLRVSLPHDGSNIIRLGVPRT